MAHATSAPTRETILRQLQQVWVPELQQNLVQAGMVGGVVVRPGKVGFALELPVNWAGDAEELRRQAELVLRKLDEGLQVSVVVTAERSPQQPDRKVAAASQWVQDAIPGVRRVVAVASGKGGVGKSTTTVNLAYALQAKGWRVGMLDADIYGPSLPLMLGVQKQQPAVKEGMLWPVMAYDAAVMSMGNLTPQEGPVVWRGSMVTKALKQMLRGVQWAANGELDILLVDMPPGTGDVVLTLAQSVPLDGVVVVSTPQQVALLDAVKALQTFQKMQVPVWGMIENMSYFEQPGSGVRSYVFGQNGVRQAALVHQVPFLGEVPLVTAICTQADAGYPLVLAAPDDAVSRAYAEIAEKVMRAAE